MKKSTELEIDLEKLLNNESIYFEYVQVIRNNIYIELEGDWKHTHLYCDHLVRLFMGVRNNEVTNIRVCEIGHSDCDWYRARRQYVLREVV